MKVVFADSETELICTDMKAASKFFGGEKRFAVSLLSRINALKAADTIKDIIVQPVFHFHNLHKHGKIDYAGCFAIDVKSRRDPWRIILEPLDENGNRFESINIDESAKCVRVVLIREVSKHYE